MVMETLFTLRKKAQALGIEDYAQYSKEELKAKIAEVESGVTQDKSDPIEEAEVAKKVEKKEVEEISAETAAELDKDQSNLTQAKKKAAKKAETKEEAEAEVEKKKAPAKEKPVKKEVEKEPKTKREPSKKRSMITYKYTPKSDEKPEIKGDMTSKIYEKIMEGEGLPPYTISKELGTYFSVVDRVIKKYFDVEKVESTKE